MEIQSDLGIDTNSKIVVHDTFLMKANHEIVRVFGIHERTGHCTHCVRIQQQHFAH